MSKKQKKERVYEYVVQSYTGAEYGWEVVYTAESREDAYARLAEYRSNEPATSHRVKFLPESDDEE